MSGRQTMMRSLQRFTRGGVQGGAADKVKRVAMTLATAILLGGATELHAQGRVFYDDFEANNTNKWTYDYSKCTTATTAADAGRPHGGAYMAKCNWDGTKHWQDPLNRSTLSLLNPVWSYNREFLIRLWYRYDRNMDYSAGNKLLRLEDYPTLSFYGGARMEAQDKQLFIAWEGIDGVITPNLPYTYFGGVAGDHNWHKLEIYVKNNTPGNLDGILRTWHDGVLRTEGVNLKTVHPGGRWKNLRLLSNWDAEGHPDWAHDALNNVYWDDIEIYSDLGSGASGSMANATISAAPKTSTPTPPSSVRVIR